MSSNQMNNESVKQKKSSTRKTNKAPKKVNNVNKKTNVNKNSKNVNKKTNKNELVSNNTSPNVAGKRHFQIIYENGSTVGRFAGNKPKQAANKAFTSLLKKQSDGGKKSTNLIKLSIFECTRNSKHKVYNYIGQRVELDEPMKVDIKGKEILYRFSNILKKDVNAVKGGNIPVRKSLRNNKEKQNTTPTNTANKTTTRKTANKTPAKTANKTLTKTANKTPAKTANKTPTKTANKTPTKTANKTPAKTANKASAKTANKTSTKTANKTPTKTANKTPTKTANKTPTKTANKTPVNKEKTN